MARSTSPNYTDEQIAALDPTKFGLKKGTKLRGFYVVNTTIKDSLGHYCCIGDRAVMTEELAKSYLNNGHMRVEVPDYDAATSMDDMEKAIAELKEKLAAAEAALDDGRDNDSDRDPDVDDQDTVENPNPDGRDNDSDRDPDVDDQDQVENPNPDGREDNSDADGRTAKTSASTSKQTTAAARRRRSKISG